MRLLNQDMKCEQDLNKQTRKRLNQKKTEYKKIEQGFCGGETMMLFHDPLKLPDYPALNSLTFFVIKSSDAIL